jgi:hypothetical protein
MSRSLREMCGLASHRVGFQQPASVKKRPDGWRARLLESRSRSHDLGNLDIFRTEFDGKPFEGLTVRLFDPQTRLWTIYRADSNAGKVEAF